MDDSSSIRVAEDERPLQQDNEAQENLDKNITNKTISKTTTDIAGTTCMELALEGERLCQSGDLKNGVKFFEEAIKVGANDDRTLSAIYSQLGNAYFYLEDYQQALKYHKQDVDLVHRIGDEAAEAKACGNLGNTFKMLGEFDKAAIYCRRYLEISRKINDPIGEGRALYNLGNVYHMQGKRMIGASEQESGDLPQDIKSSLQRAIEYYEDNLKVVSELKDSIAMGRAYGNLGNTHYLLGNFQDAVNSHKKRLDLAKQTSDKSAERRAHLNLGNANVFLGNFPEAIESYSKTLKLARELQDKNTEAHSCYSLANTYTFLRDYNSAIKYHLKYLDLIKELDDKLGEGRACWSLVNIYQMVNDPESALTYAKQHRDIAKQLGDETGLLSAKANIEELEETICQKQALQKMTSTTSTSIANSSSSTNVTGTTVCEVVGPTSDEPGESLTVGRRMFKETPASVSHQHRHHHQHHHHQGHHLSPDKRQEQEQRRFKKQLNNNLADIDGLAAARRRGRSSSTAMGDGKMPIGGSRSRGAGGLHRSTSSERLFDMIAHFQSGRIDDQRCEILKRPSVLSTAADDKENYELDSRGESGQQAKLKNQASTTAPPVQQPTATMTNLKSAGSAAASAIRATYRKASLAAYPVASQAFQSIQSQRRPTVSAEHRDQLFDLIAGAQGQRMDEQRASLPVLQMANGVLKNPSHGNPLTRGLTIDHTSNNIASSSSSTAASRSNVVQTIHEDNQQPSHRFKQRSRSIAPTQTSNLYSPPPLPLSPINNDSSKQKARIGKLTKHFQTIDSGDHAPPPVHDEKFLESLMKFQSTRFDDQRVEFPDNRLNNIRQKQLHQQQHKSKNLGGKTEAADRSVSGQVDNFFNLIVKFQSDRIDDQRSAPPAARSRNV